MKPFQNQVPLKPGDRVTIRNLSKQEIRSMELNLHVGMAYGMYAMLGQEGIIARFNQEYGTYLIDGYWWPAWALTPMKRFANLPSREV